jgi:trehalose utilization protein
MIRRHLLRALFMIFVASAGAAPIRVVVWDEQQPQQLTAYTNYLGNQIATRLRSRPDFEVKSVRLADPEQGLADETLDGCQVLIWWGHVKNGEVDPKRAAKVVERVMEGKMALLALHSAHWSEPFVQAMRRIAEREAVESLPVADRAKAQVELTTPPRFSAPGVNDPLTPRFTVSTADDGRKVVKLVLPNCCFPGFRPDGAPSHLRVLIPEHPIATGLPPRFDIPQTEMYNDPFHTPRPDFSLFEETWDKGERFRSGSVWTLGKGKIFYFRPGHETFPVYLQEYPLRVVENAATWLAGQLQP